VATLTDNKTCSKHTSMGFNYGNYGIVPPQACISQVCKCVWLPIDSATNDAIQDKEEGISIDNSL